MGQFLGGMASASIAMERVQRGGDGSGRTATIRQDSVRVRGCTVSDLSGIWLAAPWAARSHLQDYPVSSIRQCAESSSALLLHYL